MKGSDLSSTAYAYDGVTIDRFPAKLANWAGVNGNRGRFTVGLGVVIVINVGHLRDYLEPRCYKYYILIRITVPI